MTYVDLCFILNKFEQGKWELGWKLRSSWLYSHPFPVRFQLVL